DENTTQHINFVNEDWCTALKFTTVSNGMTIPKTAHYRNNYLARGTHQTANDYSRVYALLDAENSAPSGNSVLTTSLDAVIDLEEWFHIFAVEHASGNWDAVGCRNEQNMYGYKPENSKWEFMKWDMNIILGNGSWDAGANLFIVSRLGTGTSPGRQTGPFDTVMQGFFDHAPFRRTYLPA